VHAVQAVISLAQGAATVAVVTVLAALLTFYFLRDGGRLWGRVISRVRPEVAADVGAAGRRAFDVLGGYMIGTAAISFVGAASQLAIMVVLGIPLALPVFVLSFFLCFIPYIGGFISTGLAFLLTVAAGSAADVVIMGIWTIVFNLVQGNVVSPLVYGRTVHLHPAIVLVAIPAASAVAGILGMFVVVPALGVVAATWRTVLRAMSVRQTSSGAVSVALPPGEVPAPRPEILQLAGPASGQS
jgi:predicted PurR-regulated permease PerM